MAYYWKKVIFAWSEQRSAPRRGLLLLLVTRSPLMITLLLAGWLAACVGIGNLLYGLRSYGALVAGCTGAVIAMAGYSNPPHLHDLVFGRIAGIVIGIIVATTVTLFFTQRRSKRELLHRLTQVVGAEIEWIALLVQGGEGKELRARRQDILSEIAAIEDSLDAVWAGSLDLKKRKRQIQSLIITLLSQLEAGTLTAGDLSHHLPSRAPWRAPLARQLQDAARQLQLPRSIWPEAAEGDVAAMLAELRAHLPLLGETLGETLSALQAVTHQWDVTTPETERPAPHPFIRHRDWPEAGRAAGRAAFAIAAVGLTWHLTAWGEGPLMLMAAAIMVSIFSTHDRPAVMLTHIFCGASLGVTAAFFCRLVVLPGASAVLWQGVISIPILMAGIIALSHRRTALGAMDFLLFFLFVMQPGVPAVPAPELYVMGGFACLGGIGVAIVSFRFLLPVDPSRRLRSVLIAIVHDLNAMATAETLHQVEKCRARTHHRILRLLVNARKLDDDLGAIVEGGLAALVIGRRIQSLRETERGAEGSLPSSWVLRETGLKLSAALQRPDAILAVLEDVSMQLCGAMATRAEDSLPAAEPVFVGGQVRACPT